MAGISQHFKQNTEGKLQDLIVAFGIWKLSALFLFPVDLCPDQWPQSLGWDHLRS